LKNDIVCSLLQLLNYEITRFLGGCLGCGDAHKLVQVN
jgi:hypothetical protein